MNVMQLIPELNGGGVERGTVEIANALAQRRYGSVVVSGGGEMVSEIRDGGSAHFPLTVGRKALSSLWLIPKIQRLITEQQIDIVHARSRLPAWLTHLALRRMPVPARPAFITTVHGLYSVNAYSAIMTRGDCVIAVSQSAKEYVLKNYPKADEEKIRVIHRGIDTNSYNPSVRPPKQWLDAWQATYPQLMGKSVITLPGRLARLKGHTDFIRIVSALRRSGLDVTGLIVGGEDRRRKGYAQELRCQIREQGLDKAIVFTGHRKDLKYVMTQSDVVLSLSNKPESFGRTTLEALSLGVPVVAYSHGGVAEIMDRMFKQGQVASGDVDGAARKIADILRHSERPDGNNAFQLASALEREISLYETIHHQQALTTH